MNTIKIEKDDDKGFNKKESGIFRNFRNAIGIGTAASLIFLAAENGIAQTSQTPDKKLNTKNITIGTLDSLIINVNKYYPNDKAYVQSLIESVNAPDLKALINDCLQKTVLDKDFTEQEYVILMISCLEDINNKSTFSEAQISFFEKNPAMIDATLAFRKMYDEQVKILKEKLTKQIEEDKKIIEANKIEIAKMNEDIAKDMVDLVQKDKLIKNHLLRLSTNQVKNNTDAQAFVKAALKYFQARKLKDITTHEQELFDIVNKIK